MMDRQRRRKNKNSTPFHPKNNQKTQNWSQNTIIFLKNEIMSWRRGPKEKSPQNKKKSPAGDRTHDPQTVNVML